jgi:serine protease Do
MCLSEKAFLGSRPRHANRSLPVTALLALCRALALFAALLLPPSALANGLDRAMAATLIIRSDDGDARLLGSAFRFLAPDLAVTNAHVVGRAASVLVSSPDGPTRRADVIGRDELRDVALLRLPDRGPALTAGAAPGLGHEVFAIGAPFGAEFSLSRGVVSALSRQIEANVPVRMLQHDAAVNPGSSGGPLVDEGGRVVGMNSQIADGFRNFVGIAYAIPVARLVGIATALRDGTPLRDVSLGLRVRPLSSKIRAALGHSGTGVLVDHVAGGGLADRAGLRPGDILGRVADADIATPGDVAFALDTATGDRITLTVWRGGTRLVLSAAVAAPAPPAPAGTASAPETRTMYSLAEFGLALDGTRIASVGEGSFAQYLGLSPDDRLLSVDGRAATPDGLAAYRITRPALILVELSDRSTRHYVLDPWATPGRLMPVSGANVLDGETVIF